MPGEGYGFSAPKPPIATALLAEVNKLSTQDVGTVIVDEAGGFRCICGRECKDRRGLKSHQRSCKVCQSVTSCAASCATVNNRPTEESTEDSPNHEPPPELSRGGTPLPGLKQSKSGRKQISCVH